METKTYSLSTTEKISLESLNANMARIQPVFVKLQQEMMEVREEIFKRLAIDPKKIGKEINEPIVDFKKGTITVTPIEKGEIGKTKKK